MKMNKVENKVYNVNIYDYQNNLVDTVHVKAATVEDAEEEGFDLWVNEIINLHYAVVEGECNE